MLSRFFKISTESIQYIIRNVKINCQEHLHNFPRLLASLEPFKYKPGLQQHYPDNNPLVLLRLPYTLVLGSGS